LKDKRGWLALLLGLALVRGLIYMAVTPPWQAPDETGHFEYAWLIAHLGRLPGAQDISPRFEGDLLESLYTWRYGQSIGRPLPDQMPARLSDLPPQIFVRNSRTVLSQRFSLAYIWMACFIRPFLNQDLTFQLYAARLASVALALGIAGLTWRIFQELFPQQLWLVVAMTAFVVFLPQHTFINASVGEGPLAELAACIVLYGWLRLFRRPARRRDILAVLGGTLLGMWSKNTAAFLLPFDLVALGLLLRARLPDSRWLKGWRFLVAGLVLALLLGWGALQTPVGHSVYVYLQAGWSGLPINPAAAQQPTLSKILLRTYDSFWAQFGWRTVRVGWAWYLVVYALTLFALGGWALPRSQHGLMLPRTKGVLGAMLLVAVGAWLATALITPGYFRSSQGRFLFPVIVPFTFFLVGGWARWIPIRWSHHFTPGLVLLLAGLDTIAISAQWSYFYMG
jgi:hypothetical protein